ncbi:EAL domain-containing protein [Spirochaetia bacterium 38H-sp]|uniref:EAL domain-containing protein n=1 Tax=Rarispira pelagica TaxID=3141764 RepID=A0ABU9UDP3_9SPIR
MDTIRIAIVEDEAVIALDIKRRLANLGYEITGVFHSGEDFLKHAINQEADLVLMDIVLDGPISGIETARIAYNRYGIPALFLTAYADDTTIDLIKSQEGTVGYITKPFNERELVASIELGLFKHDMARQTEIQKEWLTSLLSSMGDSLIVLDNNEKIIFLNHKAEELFGFNINEIKNKEIGEFVLFFDSETDFEFPLTHLGSFPEFEGALYFKNIYFKDRQGNKIYIEGSVSRIKPPIIPISLQNKGETHNPLPFYLEEGYVLVIRDNTALTNLTSTLQYHSGHDPLTGLINRNQILINIEEMLRENEKNKKESFFIFIDIDQFKVVNNLCGQIGGDMLLKETVEKLKQIIPENSILGRLGDDEFGIIIKNTAFTKAERIARNIIRALQHYFEWEGNEIPIAYSAGAVNISREYGDVYEIISAADSACSVAKEEGGNRVKVYKKEDNDFTEKRGELSWITRLHEAMRGHKLILYAQDIIPVKSEDTPKKEILIRLMEEEGVLIPPGEFIPIAERYNIMPLLDRWIVDEMLEYAQRLKAIGKLDNTVYAINLSSTTLLDESFSDFLEKKIVKSNLPADMFCFEITETTAIKNFKKAMMFVKRFKNLGCSFALDDFGMGFSSFAYLKQLPVDYLKIDGSFVQTITKNDVDFELVKTIHNVGRIMGMKTIAEFVSDKDIFDMLASIPVDYVQGYFLGRPQPLIMPE